MKSILVFLSLVVGVATAQTLPSTSAGTFSVTGSGSTLTLNADCSQATPCRTGPDSQPVVTYFPSQVTIPAGSTAADNALIYIDAANPSVVTVGTNTMTLTCSPAGTTASACVTKSGVTSVPFGSKLLYSWPVVNGQFQPFNISYDFRNGMPITSYNFGVGFTTEVVNGVMNVSLANPTTSTPTTTTTTPTTTLPTGPYSIVAVNSNKCLDVTGGDGATGDGVNVEQWSCWGGKNQQWNLVPLGTSLPQASEPAPAPAPAPKYQIPVTGGVPATSKAVCVVGQWAWDTRYVYLCVGTNMWKRVALGVF